MPKGRLPIVLFVVLCAAAPACHADRVQAANRQSYDLSSYRRPDDLADVTVSFTVRGHLSLPGEKNENRVPMTVTARSAYQERILQLDTGTGKDVDRDRGQRIRRRSVRYYDGVNAQLVINGRELAPRLREQRRLIGASIEDGVRTLYSPHGNLLRDELDLLNLPGDSLLVDLILPQESVGIGAEWSIDNASLALLLGLDAVGDGNVKAELIEVRGRLATIEASGSVEGAVDGIASEMQLKGRWYFDVSRRRIISMQLAMHEKRPIGHVNPGVEATANIKVKFAPRAASGRLNDQALAGLKLTPDPAATRLNFTATNGAFRVLHDRDWHVTGDHPELTVMRLVQRGELLAQCNIKRLPSIEEGEQIALSAFQDEIRENLGDAFDRFVDTTEWTDEKGQQVYRVEAAGTSAELQIHWLYYLVGTTGGNRVTVVFTMEDALAERFGNADRELMAALEVLPSPATATAAPTPATVETEDATSAVASTPEEASEGGVPSATAGKAEPRAVPTQTDRSAERPTTGERPFPRRKR